MRQGDNSDEGFQHKLSLVAVERLVAYEEAKTAENAGAHILPMEAPLREQ